MKRKKEDISVIKKLEYRKIDINSFEKIWDSGYEDRFPDSWLHSFKDTEEQVWRPVLDKWLKVMREIYVNYIPVGYIFLSPKKDSSAHLGYGLYKQYRGKKLMFELATKFLEQEIPCLPKEIDHLIGTTLKTNLASQNLLKKLGFSFYKIIEEEHNDQIIEYFQYKIII